LNAGRLPAISFGLALFMAIAARAQDAPAPVRATTQPRIVAHNERTVQAVVKALENPDRDVRARAARVLGVLRRADLVPALRPLLNDPAPAVRLAAVYAVSGVGDRDSAGAYRKMLAEGETPMLRAAALRALIATGGDDLANTFRMALADRDMSVRLAAVRALPATDGVAASPLLLARLEDKNLRVKHQALLALEKVWSRGAGRLAPEVTALLDGTSPLLRAASAQVLGQVPDPAVIPLLIKRLEDSYAAARARAASALGAVGLPRETKRERVTRPLLERLKDKDYTVRAAAAAALGMFTPLPAIPHLADRLEDGSPEVRDAAASSLAGYAAKDALEATAAKVLGSRMVEARRKASWLLAEWADPIVSDTAFQALQDEDTDVRVFALRALRLTRDERALPYALSLADWEIRMKVRDREIAEVWKVAGDFKDERFIPMMKERLKVARRWNGYLMSDAGPPCSFEDVKGAILAAAHYRRPDLTAMIRPMLGPEDPFALIAEEAMAIIEGRAWEPPRYDPPRERKHFFFITCY